MPPSRRASPSGWAPQRGGTTLVALLFVLTLGALSLGLVQEGASARSAVTRQETSLEALEIAETGLARAEVELRSGVDFGEDGVGNVSGVYAGGTYEATASPDPASADRFVLRASGRRGSTARRIEVGVRRRPRARFVDALFSKEALFVQEGQRTDAYDSRLGSYASQAAQTDDGGAFARTGGNVGSHRGIRVVGPRGRVRGSAIPGPLHVVEVSGGGAVTGDTIARDEEIALPPLPRAEFEAALATNDNGSWTVVAGAVAYDAASRRMRLPPDSTLVLPGGTYFFSDLSVEAGASLQVTGPTTLYATGVVDLARGALVNATGRPGSFLLHVHPCPLPASHAPGRTEVRFGGGPHAGAAVYAPDVAVAVSGELFGAVVAAAVRLEGEVSCHYDVSLAEVAAVPGAGLERLYWREVSSRR